MQGGDAGLAVSAMQAVEHPQGSQQAGEVEHLCVWHVSHVSTTQAGEQAGEVEDPVAQHVGVQGRALRDDVAGRTEGLHYPRHIVPRLTMHRGGVDDTTRGSHGGGVQAASGIEASSKTKAMMPSVDASTRGPA